MVITAPAFTCTKASVKVNAFDLAGLKIYRSWHADGTQNGPWCSKLKSSFIVVRSANGLNWNCMCVNLNMQHLLGAWPQPVQAFLLYANYLKYFALFRYLFASLFVFVCINICMQFWTLIFMPNDNGLKKEPMCKWFSHWTKYATSVAGDWHQPFQGKYCHSIRQRAEELFTLDTLWLLSLTYNAQKVV